MGGTIYTGYEVQDFRMSTETAEYPVTVVGKKPEQTLNAKYVLTCGGLYSDRLAEKSGCNREPRIVPFRGDYLELVPEKRGMVNGNIYPVSSGSLT